MMQHAVMKADNEFSFPIRNQLFEIRGRPASGVDLVAVNIMRGRDVGLFPYNEYRTMVGLRKAASFDDLRNEMDAVNVEALKRVYADVNDIDLYSGIMLERPTIGANIGPTGGYIIAEQFAALKRGDRFYYENQVQGTRGLKPEELDAIRRTHLAKVVCMNTAGMENVPVDAFNLVMSLHVIVKDRPPNKQFLRRKSIKHMPIIIERGAANYITEKKLVPVLGMR
ncbi:animal hem peroxidase [Ancylostoma ceylanicum]|uniref:Animal hem peroxidase n=1 Tax=Ancylostoma ceylanicum TaxID=53326 RepID=A0A0D6MDJ1_9BILA|nr:animal hem peroxidase [Ancylostoma ceylanicum]